MKFILSEQDGFTLIEALISLMLSSVIILLLSGGILQAGKVKEVIVADAQNDIYHTSDVVGDRQIEWHLFLNQFENYLQGTINPRVVGSSITVSEWNEEVNRYTDVVYSRPESNQLNFARRNMGGHNRMLSRIGTLSFKQKLGWLQIEVRFLNGEEYQGRIWIESWVKEEALEVEEVEETDTD